MKVVFYANLLTRYRLEFHQQLRDKLSRDGIDYRLIHGTPVGEEAAKEDVAALPWAVRVRDRPLGIGLLGLRWQPLRFAKGADMIILGQENKHLHNYLLQSVSRRWRPRIALFGHGRNFQSRNADGLSERWKRHWATRCDWWFGYTEETRRHIEGLGFPSNRITVINNAIDTNGLRRELDSVTPERLAARRRELGLNGAAVGLFIGGLYADKRLDFLIRAAIRVRREIPGFELVIVGAGPAEAELRSAAAPHPWIKLAGPQFGQAKAEIMRLADLFLMPGLVGLAVLDAGVAGLPLVTTDFPYHSPEIAYLVDGETGHIVCGWPDDRAYADAVAALLRDRSRLERMAEAAREAAAGYTIEAMAERFAGGVMRCLGYEASARIAASHQAAT